MTILNLTEAVLLARLVLEHWERSPDFELYHRLHLKEPAHIARARHILTTARGRIRWNSNGERHDG